MRSDGTVTTSRIRARAAALLAVAAVALVATACGADDTKDGDAAPERTLTVFAAASLTETFTELGQQFEDANPGVTVSFNFLGSSDLAAQIIEGAPADVFASADVKNMLKVTAEKLEASAPIDFARNSLEIVTPPDNPAGIKTLKDLTKKDVAVVVCAAEVPCGSAAATVTEAAGLTLDPVSEEQSVKDVLAKVTAGEADAGLVYVTDAKAAGDAVRGIAFPESAGAVNTYPITALKDSEYADLASDFVNFVLGESGQSVLAEAGFAKP